MHFVENWAWLVTWQTYVIYSNWILQGFCLQLTLNCHLGDRFYFSHFRPPPFKMYRDPGLNSPEFFVTKILSYQVRRAPRIWSLVALFCFSWRGGPVPPFPVPCWNALYAASSWILSRESAYAASSKDMFILSLFTQLAWISSAWVIFGALSNWAKDVIPSFVPPLYPALEILPLLAFCDKGFEVFLWFFVSCDTYCFEKGIACSFNFLGCLFLHSLKLLSHRWSDDDDLVKCLWLAFKYKFILKSHILCPKWYPFL